MSPDSRVLFISTERGSYLFSMWCVFVLFLSNGVVNIASAVKNQPITETGLFESPCTVNSDCQLGFICLYKTCSCSNSYIYDYTKQACRKICRGSTERLKRYRSSQRRYELLKERYTNCTYVEENLEITNLEGDFDLSFLRDIEEVMGYVLIVNVFSNYLNLTNLRIIRGETLYDKFSLYVALNHNPYNDLQGLLELQFISLSEIIQGQVYLQNNSLLCHADTIRWEDINPGTIPPVKIIFNSPNYRRQCGSCHPSCYNTQTGESHCWGSGPDMCQKLNYVKDVCHESCDSRCFGSQENECCHPECAGGCQGPRKTQCYACKHFYNEGQCDNFCPSMQIYDAEKMKFVANPDGRYAFGTWCVKDCPNNMLKHEEACVRVCPPGTRSDLDKNECVPEDRGCNEPCTEKHEHDLLVKLIQNLEHKIGTDMEKLREEFKREFEKAVRQMKCRRNGNQKKPNGFKLKKKMN